MNGFSYWLNRDKNLTVTLYPYLTEITEYVTAVKNMIS